MPQTRPDHLEEFIRSLVRECRGVCAPDFDRVKRSVGYAKEDLRRYLGTYYPRSLLETYDIASELFRKIFGTEVRTDGELKILDLGCGLGGASTGLLFAVLERFGVRKVSVDGFDANEASLRTFERILGSESFALAREELRGLMVPGAQAEVVVRLKRARIDSERFDLLGDESRYDVILTSKMLNELPVERKYFRFLETYLPHLAQNGLCFVIDVNDRREGRYISQRLSEETLAFLGRHDGFECLLPPGCRDCAKRGLPCGGFNQIVCRESNFNRLNPFAARGVSKSAAASFAARLFTVTSVRNSPVSIFLRAKREETMSTLRVSIPEEYPVIAPVILSASRSTDIPARHAKWFMERLRQGWFGWVNPFNRKRYAVSLENTRAIVFWTKHAAPLFSYLDKIEERGFHFYFQYTLNDYEAEGLEPKIPPLDRRIETFRGLSEKIGAERVIWRFDPIILHDGQSARDILHKIWNLSKRLRGATEKLVVSFADVSAYRKVQRNLVAEAPSLYSPENVVFAEPTEAQIEEIAEGLRKIQAYWHDRGWDFVVAACAEKMDLTRFGIERNSCVDGELLARLFPEDEALMAFLTKKKKAPAEASLFSELASTIPIVSNLSLKDKGQRKECGCIESKDIGMYDTCANFCAYCYANASRNMVKKNLLKIRASDGHSPFLIPMDGNESETAETADQTTGRVVSFS